MQNLYELGAFLEPAPQGSEGQARHIVGGKCNLKGAVAPNSGKPLVQYAALYVASGEIACNTWNSEYISLLYSWTCPIYFGPFSYRQGTDSIEILKVESGTEAENSIEDDDFPYPDYRGTFAAVPAVLVPLTDHQRVAIVAMNSATEHETRAALKRGSRDLFMPRHQVGGEPYWLQPHEVASCPLCNKRMKFLASMGNNTFSESYNSRQGFVGNEFVQVVFDVCFDCNAITVNQYAD